MTKEEQYQAAAEQLVKLVGGKDNIINAAHCATRLRLVLKDETKADVDEVYKRFIAVAGINESTKSEVKQAAVQKMNPLQRLVKTLSDVFVPLIPALVASGLMMGSDSVRHAESGTVFRRMMMRAAGPGSANWTGGRAAEL